MGHSYEADYWSCGIILYNMIYGYCPYTSDVVDEVYHRIVHDDYFVDEKIDPNANELIKMLLTRDVGKRASYEEVMKS